ncbi:MAG: hypothetical protein GY713_04120 [Actinomycetia bacterium]|nr:hypothetical protein [Actinomycetes bacterium]
MNTRTATPSTPVETGRPDRAWGPILGLVLVGIAALEAARPLGDNSFLTHLSTGRLILEGGGLPVSDPYTFTSAGESWIAQSWFASVLYALVEAGSGGLGLRLLHMSLVAVLAALVWWLTSPAVAPTTRLVVAAPVIMLGLSRWSERPHLLGLIGLALVLAALQGRIDPRLLVPVMWVWVNSHGSFPLAFALVGAWLMGALMDRRGVGPALTTLAWVVAGVLVAGLNPYGPRLWVFPLELMGRSDVLREYVKEWQPIGIGQRSAMIFAVIVLLAVLAASRTRRWAEVLPAVGFAVGAFMSIRNTAPATIVMIPVLVRGLTGEEIGRLPPVSAATARRVMTALTGVFALAVVALLGVVPSWDWEGYPTVSLDKATDLGLTDPSVRLVARDFVGNLRAFREGANQSIFIDDRYELHDEELISDQAQLLNGISWEEILDRYRADVVLWEADTELGQALVESDQWETIESEPGWIMACRRDSMVASNCR